MQFSQISVYTTSKESYSRQSTKKQKVFKTSICIINLQKHKVSLPRNTRIDNGTLPNVWVHLSNAIKYQPYNEQSKDRLHRIGRIFNFMILWHFAIFTCPSKWLHRLCYLKWENLLQYGSNHDQKKPFLWQEHLGNRCFGNISIILLPKKHPCTLPIFFLKKKSLWIYTLKKLKAELNLIKILPKEEFWWNLKLLH